MKVCVQFGNVTFQVVLATFFFHFISFLRSSSLVLVWVFVIFTVGCFYSFVGVYGTRNSSLDVECFTLLRLVCVDRTNRYFFALVPINKHKKQEKNVLLPFLNRSEEWNQYCYKNWGKLVAKNGKFNQRAFKILKLSSCFLFPFRWKKKKRNNTQWMRACICVIKYGKPCKMIRFTFALI